MRIPRLFLLLALACALSAQAAPLSGTKSVGPTGDYASLTAAIADVNAAGNGLGGALVLELQSTYVSAVETFPLTIPALGGASATNTLTIRPASGATALSISSADTTAATMDLNGAQFVTIDGRPGGVGSNAGSGGGTASQLTIANTNTTFGVALRFINEAGGNTIRYTTLRSVNNSSFSGTVVFSATTGANGNDNNTIDHCDIREGASTPANDIYSSGSTGTTAQANSGNTVSNCNVLNFYSINGAAAAGVRLDGGNTDWTLTGNSFYQSASRAAVSGSFSRPIYVNNTSGNNFTVTGNFIGGSAPNAGGTAWTTTGTANAYQFVGIHLNVGNTTASSVQGNTLANIVWTSSYNLFTIPGVWSGIYVERGNVNVGTVMGNTIGSGTGTGSVSVTTSGQGGTSSGISSQSTGTLVIANNTIGSITVNGSATTVSASLFGIQSNAGANTISNNTVGSTTTANSLNAATSSTSATGQQVTGILSSSSTSNAITGNTVRNLFTTSPNQGTFASASVLGISQSSTVAGQTISQNAVHTLVSTAASGVKMFGIYFACNTTTGPNLVARNLVHSLMMASTDSATSLQGMHFSSGTFTAQNNMVRVGLDAGGISTAGGATITGIGDNTTTAGRNFFHNSVYVGGTQTAGGSNPTHAFISGGSSNARDFRDNIFVNARTNSGASSSHYAISHASGATTTGLTVNNNLYVASGAGGLLGYFNSAGRTTLAALQAATGQDAASAVADPLFVNPTGNSTTVDLHVQTTSPADSAAAVLAAVTDDFDGQPRRLTLPDIGADEFDAPAIVVEQPSGTHVGDGGGRSFGNVALGNSASLTFTIRNTGSAPLTGLGVTFDGTDAAQFSVTASPLAPVAAGDSTTFTVQLTPTVAGNKYSALHIASNVGGAKNLYDISLAAFTPSPAPLTGTRTVGPTGHYSSLTQAIADIQGATVGGPFILELQPAYVSTVETFPLTIPALNGASATNTLTIRPASGATALSISSAETTAATVDLNGAQFVTIDGRPGGAGAVSQLSIANTSTSGVALRFINEASGNTLRYTTLRGVNTSATSGVVVFSTTTGANGNDNNTIDHCDIRDGASTPTNGIYSAGTITTTEQGNSGNTVSNCNIFNFYAATAVDSAGVRLDSGSTDWTITGNSFYQTASRAGVGASVRAIYITITFGYTGNNLAVTNNTIGGSTTGGGGTAWTTTGTVAAYRFVGIDLRAGSTTPSSIQGNTITNFVWTSSSTASTQSGVWSGIFVQSGTVNIGTVTGNTIGGGTGTGSVSLTTAGNGGTAFGIAAIGGVAIANNIVGSITANGSTTSVSASLVGISLPGGAGTISNNTVGSTTTANSLNAATSSTAATGQQVTGILSSAISSTGITGNTVANLNNNYAGTATAGQIRGIATTAGVNTITGNTVRNLSTTSQNAGTTTSASVLGIIQTSTEAGQSVSQNTVHSLASTAGTAAVSVTGIYYACLFPGANVVVRNLVHSLSTTSTSPSSGVTGMEFGAVSAGSFTVKNNMVRVGIGASGANAANASVLRGIFDNGTTAGRNFYHNSVYLGGTLASGAANSFAFASSGVSNTRDFRNNIFVNARTNSGGTGKHYAVNCGGTSVNPTGLTAGGNIFFVSGIGGVLGLYNSTDCTTLGAWQSATGQDRTSAVVNPLFVNATGNATAVDLHLQAGNPAEGGALPISAVTDDFDSETRSGLLADIGADAGDFTVSSDVFAPAMISYLLLTSGSTVNRVITGWVTITDNVGVASGASAPRLYYKKSTDADTFGVANDSTGNGWKSVPATGSTTPYGFTMDYTLINGGSVSPGDTIQYFVVAQDAANNLASSPAGATASGTPSVENVNAHGSVNSFTIFRPLTAINTVGAGGDYPSLTGTIGIFTAINNSVLTGNLVINITSDVTEDGSVRLNRWAETGAGNYTVTLQPDSATMRTISGASANGLITFNGAHRVTIDGRIGGAGRYLTFRNTSTANTASTLLFIGDASSNTVRGSIVEGASGSDFFGVIGFSTGTATGNDNNLITDCQVRDLSTAAGVPRVLVGSVGSSATVANSGNTISNSDLFNFNVAGIYIDSTGNNSWTISGNNIFELNAATSTGSAFGIRMQGDGINVISGNSIHDLLANGVARYGIYFAGVSTTTITGNRIAEFNVNGAMPSVVGIYANGSSGSTLNAVNNQITLSPAASISTTLYGFYDNGSTGSVVNAFYNSIVIGGTESGTRGSWASRRTGASTHTARNNIFLNLRSGGTGSHFAVGNESSTGATGYIVSNNVYAGTGTTAANFMDFNTTTTPFPVSFAMWQSATGDTASQAGLAGTGNFTAAMFVNAATGDLHLVSGGNPLVTAMGIPVVGITDDFDGDTRSATAPDIGVDELSSNADLGTLTLSTGILSPAFAGGTTSYTASVSNNTTAVTFTPTQSSGHATVSVNGSSAATPVALTVGANTVTILVTAQDGTTKTYTVTVTRNTMLQDWAEANGVSSDPDALGANGVANLLNFAFGVNPVTGGSGGLVFNGAFGAGGTIGATGQPITMLEPTANGVDFRALFVRRKNFAAAGLTYTPQFSASMASWTNSAVVPTVLADDGVNQIVSVPYPPFIGGKKARFFRLSVTLGP